jgi:MFS family permease
MLKVLQIKKFKYFFFSQLISDIGNWLDFTALFIIMAYKWNLGADYLAIYAVAVGIPWVIVGPFGGVLADRLNLKKLMIMTDLTRGFIVLSFIFVNDFFLLIALVFLKSCISTLFEPARNISIKTLVPEKDLMKANSLNQLSMHSSKIIGPALGSLIMTMYGTEILFILDALTFFLAALIIGVFLNFPYRDSSDKSWSFKSFVYELGNGYKFIKSNLALKNLLLLNTFVFFNIFLFDSLGVLLAKKIGFQEHIFGIFITVVALGSVLGAFLINHFEKKLSISKLVFYCSIFLGVTILFTGIGSLGLITKWLPLWLFIWCLIGLCMSSIFISYGYILHKTTPKEILGQVSSTGNAMMNFCMISSPLIGSVISKIIGISGVFILSGSLMLLASMLVKNKNYNYKNSHIIQNKV